MQNRVRSFFNDYSSDFAALYGTPKTLFHRMINSLFRKSMLLRYNKTLEHCRQIAGKTVLDIGCGPGLYSIALAKLGASRVLGIDFSEKMTGIATEASIKASTASTCRFETVDFFTLSYDEKYDYIIVMGVMDYIENAEGFLAKATQMANERILLSFPATGGILAWQRKARYRFKCPLFLYSETQLHSLLQSCAGWMYQIERISRDYYVSMEKS